MVILSRVPYPLEKGDKLRAYHQLKELKKRHEIILCCLADGAIHGDAQKALSSISDSVHIFKLKKWRILFNLVFSFLSRLPFQVIYFYQKPVHRKIQSVIALEKPDHIYCQLIRTAEYAKNEHDIGKTLDYQDAFSKGMERRESGARWPLSEIFASERKRLIAYENIIFEYFEQKTIISEEDRRFIYHPERKDIDIITNGIDTDFFHPLKTVGKKYDLLFVGNMSYPPNIETSAYIVKTLLPLLQKSMPNITLLLAGSSPHRKVMQLAEHKGVTVSGWIDDIRDAYQSAQLFLAPMQIGTGLQNKLLEAMAMEMPCVTSTLANRSLKAASGGQLIVCDEADAFCEAILRLLQDPESSALLGSRARTFVASNFSWETSVRRLESVMARSASAETV